MIQAEIDGNSLKETLKKLGAYTTGDGQGSPIRKGLSNAINRSLLASRTAGSVAIRKVYTIKAGDIKSRVAMMRSTAKTLEGQLKIKGPTEKVVLYRVRISHFKKKGTRLFVTIKKGQGGVVTTGFAAKGRLWARTTSARYPIKPLHGPSVPQLWGNPAVMAAVQKAGMETLKERTKHELERIGGAT